MEIIRFIDGNMGVRQAPGRAAGGVLFHRGAGPMLRGVERGESPDRCRLRTARRQARSVAFQYGRSASELVVIDAARFATTLARGIGRTKAFGCGLLLVRPLD